MTTALLAVVVVTVVGASPVAGAVVARRAPVSSRPTPRSAPATGIALGAYVDPTAAQGTEAVAVSQLESAMGRPLSILNSFWDWEGADGTMNPFPTKFATYAASVGAVPMLTWQPEQTPSAGNPVVDEPAFSLAQLASGRYDGYVTAWADAAKAYGGPVYVRLMHEMNGDWYPWGNGVNGNTSPAQYVVAWQHVVDIFRSVGADNVEFVWCASSTGAADPADFFPGDAYASWIALDGYNRDLPWETLTQVFGTPYDEITAVSSLPVMFAEIGTVEEPGDPTGKASWITSAFTDEIPQNFPRVAAALYFDSNAYELTSSTAALDAFAQVSQSSAYQGTAPTPPPGPPPPAGYDMVGGDGGVFVFGGDYHGSLPGLGVRVDDVTGIVPTATDDGYFLVGADGGVFSFDAPFAGSLPGLGVHVDDVVGIVPTLDDHGYFLVGRDGGVFSFDAPFEDSLPGIGVHVDDVVGIASTTDDRGYWLLGADGTVYAFGDAVHYGDAPAGAAAIEATAGGGGYWVVGTDGSVTAFGDARSFGDLPADGVSVDDVTGMVPSPDDLGYDLIGRDGGVFAFGDAPDRGSLPALGVRVDDVIGAVPS